MNIYYKFLNLLVTLGLMKPFRTYRGRKVTEFRHNFEAFMIEYRRILRKKSGLTRSRRDFVEREIKAWLKENKIPVQKFNNEILN